MLAELRRDPYLGDLAAAQLTDRGTVTREPYRQRGRITPLSESAALDPARDRVMASVPAVGA